MHHPGALRTHHSDQSPTGAAGPRKEGLMAPTVVSVVESRGYTLSDLFRSSILPDGFGRTDGVVAAGLHGATMFASLVIRIKVRETGPRATRHRYLHASRTGYDGEISAAE